MSTCSVIRGLQCEPRPAESSSGLEDPSQATQSARPSAFETSSRVPENGDDFMDCDEQQTSDSGNSQIGGGCKPLTGFMARVPREILEDTLKHCRAKDLACLEVTCAYFLSSGVTEKMAKERLQEIPRAKGLIPRKNERWLHLYQFVLSQSSAAAQSTAISSGALHTSALLVPYPPKGDDCSRHYIYSFGRGFNGQLGFKANSSNTVKNQLQPREVSLGYMKLSEDPKKEEEIMPAVLSCGSSHTISISRKGTLYGWGLTTSGELGLGTTSQMEVFIPRRIPLPNRRVVSVTAGGNHSLVITEIGELWTCGHGRRGQLGLGSFEDTFSLTRVDAFKLGVRIVSAAAGTKHSLALAADGSLYSWGAAEFGQLGHPSLESEQVVINPVSCRVPRHVEDLDPRRLAPQDRVTSISAGGNHSVALTVSGSLLAFGRNHYGQLGVGDTECRWRPTMVNLSGKAIGSTSARAVQVVCGINHTIALVLHCAQMSVMATGSNNWGQLGLGDTEGRLVLRPVRSLMKQAVISVQCGAEHSCAVSRSGKIFFWGRGDCGQLGTGSDRSHKTAVALEGFRLVHPDRTLRRAHRCKPRIRPIIRKKPAPPKIPQCFRSTSKHNIDR